MRFPWLEFVLVNGLWFGLVHVFRLPAQISLLGGVVCGIAAIELGILRQRR